MSKAMRTVLLGLAVAAIAAPVANAEALRASPWKSGSVAKPSPWKSTDAMRPTPYKITRAGYRLLGLPWERPASAFDGA
jgi:hypothetical protein